MSEGSMGLREDAKAEAAKAVAEVAELAEAEGSAGAATNGQIEAAERASFGDDSEGDVTAALARSAQAMANGSGNRHGVPDTHVYDPNAGRYLADGEPQKDLERLRASLDRAKAVEAATPARSAPVVVQGTALHLTPQQYEVLLRPIHPERVKQRQGQSHLEAWDVRRQLIRIFGFGGFNIETVSREKIFHHIAQPGEIQYGNGGTNKRPAYTVVYDCVVRLTVKNPDGSVGAVFEDAATGDGSNMPSYQAAADFALKTAESQALKRCAVNLGDQFGLSLYNGGSYSPVVNRTLAGPVIEGGSAVIDQVVETGAVYSEQESQEYRDDPGRGPGSDENGMPTAFELRDEGTNPSTSRERLSAIYAMVHRTRGSHPALGTTEVTNENGDAEPLDALIYRKIQERKQ